MVKSDVKPHSIEPLKPETSTGGVLVLQWLTYAFWGWLIVALIWLTSVILVNTIVGDDVSKIIPYAIAASIVLLPLAFVSDLFYRKHEPLRKTGAAMVIMLIHAVLFALLAIGALIISVFTGLNALINSADSNEVTTVIILTTIIATILFGAAFLRTLNPFKKKTGATVYGLSMLGATILLLIIGIVGPVVATITTRDDKRIEQSLGDVQNKIQTFTSRNDALPQNLSELSFRPGDAKDLIAENEIEFIPEGISDAPEDEGRIGQRASYRYQLCVTYDRESKESTSYSYVDEYDDRDGYSSSLFTTPHDAGRVCYKVRTY